MIRYRLVCATGHQFDGWFRSSADHDTQAKRGFIACPDCGSTAVTKAIMAPSVVSGVAPTAEAAPREVAPSLPPPGPEDLRRAALIAALREMRQRVVAEAEHVGPRFPEEARRIHYGEIEPRGIYGEASPDEARSLLEEGVAICPLPMIPDELS